MLADKAFCDMVHSIGVASLCADDKQIWHLTKIYWYTVEFGVVEEGNDIKAFGAGAPLQHFPKEDSCLLPHTLPRHDFCHCTLLRVQRACGLDW